MKWIGNLVPILLFATIIFFEPSRSEDLIVNGRRLVCSANKYECNACYQCCQDQLRSPELCSLCHFTHCNQTCTPSREECTTCPSCCRTDLSENLCSLCTDRMCSDKKICHPGLGCNVCPSCCQSYLLTKDECSDCVREQCWRSSQPKQPNNDKELTLLTFEDHYPSRVSSIIASLFIVFFGIFLGSIIFYLFRPTTPTPQEDTRRSEAPLSWTTPPQRSGI